MANPLSRREVIKFGAYTTVGGALTPGISLAQAITTDVKDITAREVQIPVGGATIPGYDAHPSCTRAKAACRARTSRRWARSRAR